MLLRPTVSPPRPGGHAVQAVMPSRSMYRPSGQALQPSEPAAAATKPAVQLVHAVAPRPDVVPAGQAAQPFELLLL
jgi:hypothetical protein